MPAASGITQIMGVSIELIGLWMAALLTLAIYSFLYDDNPIYKFAEHLFVGVSAAYGAAILYNQVLIPKLIKPIIEKRADVVVGNRQFAHCNWLKKLLLKLGSSLIRRLTK